MFFPFTSTSHHSFFSSVFTFFPLLWFSINSGRMVPRRFLKHSLFYVWNFSPTFAMDAYWITLFWAVLRSILLTQRLLYYVQRSALWIYVRISFFPCLRNSNNPRTKICYVYLFTSLIFATWMLKGNLFWLIYCVAAKVSKRKKFSACLY